MKYISLIFFLSTLFSIPCFAELQKEIPSQSDYGILTPMYQEGIAILNKMTNKHEIKISGITYTIGMMNGKNIVHAYTGIGKVNAAIATYGLISNFHPHIIYLAGIAGTLNPDAKIGDIVVGKQVYALERDKVRSESRNNLGPINNKVTPQSYSADAELLKKVEQIKNQQPFNIIIGKIGTSDNLPNTKNEIEQLKIDHADAVDMEGSAVAHVCWLFNISCLVIRGNSNSMAINISADQAKTSFKIPQKDKELAITHLSDFATALIK
jgi:adenosylhomocysteine nucleosidase